MIQTGFESRVKVQQIVESQLPSFILDENPNASEFLKQYYISQEYQGGPIDIAENLDQYLKLDNLTPEVIVGETTLSANISSTENTIQVESTKGFPPHYGLFQIDDEIITYTDITANSFTGCIRGFSGITGYHQDLNQEELIFTETKSESHTSGSKVKNLSSLFLKEFYNKLKFTIAHELQDTNFTSSLDVGTFLKELKSFYQTKGTNESFRILFNALYNETPSVVNLEQFLLKPSHSEYLNREVVIAEGISGITTSNLVGQTIKKVTDETTSASISSIEPFTRNGKTYFKLTLFVGYNDFSAVEGNFVITPSTKTTLSSPSESSIITVDSTIGFPQSGTLYSGNNTIEYTSKSINQFFGCSGITEAISKNEIVRNNDIYYGYENGDTTKRVELRFVGVLSDLVKSNSIKASEGDLIKVKNLGNLIKNPATKNYTEIFANSWIYNTASSYEVVSTDSNYTLGSEIDRSSLKVGDRVELVDRGTRAIQSDSDNPYIQSINSSNNVSIDGSFSDTQSSIKYDLRRIINTANSSGVSIENGNNTLTSDIQNLYTDSNDYAYIASNSLPSGSISGSNNYRYNITKSTYKFTINSLSSLQDKDSLGDYTTISSTTNIPFITGDKIYYSPLTSPLVGLEEGIYYVEVISPKSIRLYTSRSFIGGTNYLSFSVPNSGISAHTFILYSHRTNQIGAQKLFKKFPLKSNIKSPGKKTEPGTTGMLINGVEISNYKSEDKIYYGPLESISVFGGGEDFDVINLPNIELSSDNGSGALVQPVISGSFKEIYVDSQNYDIDKILSIDISGGNGTGAVIKPILTRRFREVSFDGRLTTNSGGISTSNNRIIFLSDHNFQDGEEIIYNSNGNSELVVGSGSSTLINNSSYFVKVQNNITISIFESVSDYAAGINTVGFSTGTSGTHKFRTANSKNVVSDIEIINGGSGYTNRKLVVSPSKVSTTNHTINFDDHGFKSGELVEYSFQTSTISGLSTSNQYYILKIDDDSFRLCDAGIGGTITSNYNRENFVKFSTSGNGYQYFKYPDISVTIKYNPVGFSTSTQVYQNLLVTPVVRGSIDQLYLYNKGTGYGSKVLNYENSPTVQIKNGKYANISPNILNGSINSVTIQYGGIEYYSVPDLVVIDPTNKGSGAKLRPIISNGAITEVKVINAGIGYSTSSYINVVSSGKGASLKSNIRSLTVNANLKLGDENSGSEILVESDNKLKYTVSGYFNSLRDSFGESASNSVNPKISGIIGWAYDGNPIYGPFGYSNPEDKTSITRLTSGYSKDITKVLDRPSGFAEGFFIEDYQYTNSGSLDQKNGRFEKTPEFPNGVYAYHATVESSGTPTFPYFIGNEYHSETLSENQSLNQEFDFKSSTLLRNTFPYKVSDIGSSYDYFIEIDDIKKQEVTVESVSFGSVDNFSVINAGDNYKVGDSLNFDRSISGGGVDAIVSSLKGKSITKLETSSLTYPQALFTWNDVNSVKVNILPNHSLKTGDYISISGFASTLSNLNGIHKVAISPESTSLISSITSAASIGTTEIYVSYIPESVSAGSSIGIGTETLMVLNTFKQKGILRVERGLTNVSHNQNTTVSFNSDSFTIPKEVEYFESKLNDKVYFNPQESVGIGTIVGLSTSVSFDFGGSNITRSIPTKSIYIENHPFKNNQQISYASNGTNILISTDGISVSSLPLTLYVVNKGKDLVGLKTELSSSELFFHSNGDDNDKYLFESIYPQITGTVSRIKTTVSVSTSHGLLENDVISLNVQPSLSVGIGTSTSVKITRDSNSSNILVNPIGFNSTGINTSSDTLTLTNHNLNTGDKVNYSADIVASGLSTGSFYVYKVDDDQIKLCETEKDSLLNPPTVVSIAGTGGSSQTIAKINPRIVSIRNNDLVFDLSDSSLSGYNFKIYTDNQFKNEFVSTGSTGSFNYSLVGTTLTISYDSSLPEKLFYTLEKSGSISTTDTDVQNYSEILLTDSDYNNTYSVVGVGTTTFDIVLYQNPERLSYTSTECDSVVYTTTSTTASGPIDGFKIISSGGGYKKLPTLSSITSANGKGANVVAKSNTIGVIKSIKTNNDEFEYPSDPTLQPKANISPLVVVKDANELESVSVVSGGNGFISTPDIVIVDSDSGKKINSGVLEAELSGSSIQFVNIISPPKGLPDTEVKIRTVNNNNGFTIHKVQSDSTGIFTCFITKPVSGVPYFATNDKVFIEGIQKFSTTGSGFNCEDYSYDFFTVAGVTISSPYDEIKIDISGITTNPGIAKTIQDGSGVLILEDDYPTFTITQKKSTFEKNEILTLENNNIDLNVLNFDGYFLEVNGTYELSVGQVVIGSESGSSATIHSIDKNDTNYSINYSVLKNFGWNDDFGKLNSDFQVIPDNDYYQNLSYTVKSSKKYSTLESSVFNVLHTSGMKNFADTEIKKTVNISGIGSTDSSVYLYNVLGDERVDSIYNFDFVKDYNVISGTSKFLAFKNQKLADFFESKENNVLSIDDISSQFSYFEDSPTEFLNISKLDNTNSYDSYLISVSNLDNTKVQFAEIVILSDKVDNYILRKGNVSNQTINPGSFDLVVDEFDDSYFRFVPEDPYDTDYDLKIHKVIFEDSIVGIGTTSVGFIDIIGKNETATSGITTTLVGVNTNNFGSLYANVQVIDNTTNDMNFVELYLTHDGENTYISEYYFDSEIQTGGYSGNFMGSFTSDISNDILSLSYTNNTQNTNTLRAKVVGFGTTSTPGVGGSYRFKLERQPDGSERTIIYQSNNVVGVGVTTVLSIDKNKFNAVKSLVEVGIGTIKSVHQVYMIQDTSDVHITQSALLSVSGITTFDTAMGIGTFGGNNSGSTLDLTFTPDSDYSASTITVSALSELFYTDLDISNVPPALEYGKIREDIDLKFYNAINGDRINKTNFALTHNGTPIFVKVFDPQDTNALISTTGTFNINNHFFKNGEELIYTPKSSIIGIATTAMTYTNFTSGVTDTLPSTVFAVVTDFNRESFQISTTRSGDAVTFTDLGGGNIHQFEMANKSTKSIIVVDDAIQHPITFSGASTTLSGSIGTTTNTFTLSGISSINPLDILKVNNEYMRVNNVGLGTSSVGPVTGIGTFNVVDVDRGFVGTSATNHSNGNTVDIYRGSFNIVENVIHFTQAPRGNPQIDKTKSNLDFETSDFNGRVFLRSDYATNKIYDDISNEFNGIGRTFTLTTSGLNTSGIGTGGGNGIVLINGIFQQPSTDNNPNGNFNIFENTSPSPGITTIVFSGITSANSDPAIYITSDVDVNQNQTPRGGIIVSYGSTPGLGFAPLVGASVTAIVGAGGTIAGITTDLIGGTFGSGYYGLVSVAITETGHSGAAATITAVVGAGGTLTFSIDGEGSNYNNPSILVSSPSYENLSVVGVSRIGIGTTTTTGIGLSMSLSVGPVGETGAGATYFGVTEFEFSKIGYGFRKGDVFKPVGLVTDGSLSSPLQDFEITVLETYSDTFAAWEFGELDFIDSIKEYQDGSRVTFPLNYNGELRSFELPVDGDVDLASCLLIFINGILQVPGTSYIFGGGTSFQFTNPPKEDDNISIYFYKGSGNDVRSGNTNTTIQVGDTLTSLAGEIGIDQQGRVVTNISSSDVVETNPYSGVGINELDWKPVKWTKQKSDKKINGENVSKERDSLKSLVFPTANIISDVDTSANMIFVDSIDLFRYEDPDLSSFNALVVDNVSVGIGTTDPVEYVELISNFTNIIGNSGDVIGIASTGSSPLGIEFELDDVSDISTGYPIYITDTKVGSGVTSILSSSDSDVVAIGSTYLDNIYHVQQVSVTPGSSPAGIVTCYVDSNSNLVGIDTTGKVGKFSWGRLSNTVDLERLNPISIGVTGRVVSGLSTYPVIMRRGGDTTLRQTGSIYRI